MKFGEGDGAAGSEEKYRNVFEELGCHSRFLVWIKVRGINPIHVSSKSNPLILK